MKNELLTKYIALIAITFIFALGSSTYAQTTAFTFQGKLNDGALAANGTYQFQFKLYDAASGGNQIGNAIADLPATVTGGIFSVNLDFGAASFDGAGRYLEIGVRMSGSGQTYTILNPRQQVMSTPYAIRSLNANTANAANDAANLGGVPAAQYTKTNDPRLSDDRNPLAGSDYYIRNSQFTQPNATFIIGGNATSQATLTGNAVNSVTQYNIGGNRVLGIAGTNNVFAGIGAGAANTGNNNSFVGRDAGAANVVGSHNSFFGASAGDSNMSGSNNAFVGSKSGQTNTTGSNNSFFGTAAGFSNLDGEFNTFAGSDAGRNNKSGYYNSFFGESSGKANTTATQNSFFGYLAGTATTTGGENSFFGSSAGLANLNGTRNTFVGNDAGKTNTTGFNNTLIGAQTALGSANLKFAAAIGSGATVNTDNTIVLGRNTDSVQVPGNLSAAGNTALNNVTVDGSLKVQGSSVAFGFEKKTVDEVVAAHLSGSKTLTCSAGLSVISGGVVAINGSSSTFGDYSIKESGPASSNSWYFLVDNDQLYDVLTLRYTIVCAKIN